MIYTGYYACLNKYIDAGLVPISIAGKAPKFYCGYEYKALAPKYDFLFVGNRVKQIILNMWSYIIKKFSVS